MGRGVEAGVGQGISFSFISSFFQIFFPVHLLFANSNLRRVSFLYPRKQLRWPPAGQQYRKARSSGELSVSHTGRVSVGFLQPNPSPTPPSPWRAAAAFPLPPVVGPLHDDAQDARTASPQFSSSHEFSFNSNFPPFLKESTFFCPARSTVNLAHPPSSAGIKHGSWEPAPSFWSPWGYLDECKGGKAITSPALFFIIIIPQPFQPRYPHHPKTFTPKVETPDLECSVHHRPQKFESICDYEGSSAMTRHDLFPLTSTSC